MMKPSIQPLTDGLLFAYNLPENGTRASLLEEADRIQREARRALAEFNEKIDALTDDKVALVARIKAAFTDAEIKAAATLAQEELRKVGAAFSKRENRNRDAA